MDINARFSPPPRYLMCRPQHFAVTYSINPWMDPAAWSAKGGALAQAAARQWQGLHRALASAGGAIELVEPQPGLPDLVFTANAAVVLDGKALLARFRHGERQAEQPVFAAAFERLRADGLIEQVVALPDGVMLEGAGDCLWDAQRAMFWMGCGFRSDASARDAVAAEFGVPAVALALADPAYYHLDTCFHALPCGGVIYYPAAFTAAARAEIEARVPPADRIVLEPSDAARFAANAVCVGGSIILSAASERLRAALTARGYRVVTTPLGAFLRSGGSACCLTLRLDWASAVAGVAGRQRTAKRR